MEDSTNSDVTTKKARATSHYGKRAQQKPQVDRHQGHHQMNAHIDQQFWSRADCIAILSDILDELTEHHTGLQKQYGQFLTTYPEFLKALRLIKPSKIQSFNTIQDVKACHMFLQQSHSVGKSVRADLVAQFLDLIRSIRDKTGACEDVVTEGKSHLTKYVIITDFLASVHSVKSLLNPKYNLNALPSVSDPELKGILDRKLFSGLVCYLPALIQAESNMAVTLNRILMALKFQDSVNVSDKESQGSCVVGEISDKRRASEALTEKAVNAYCETLSKLTMDGSMEAIQLLEHKERKL